MFAIPRCAPESSRFVYVDYVPLVSTVSAIVTLFIKIHAIINPDFQPRPHLYTCFLEKDPLRTCISAIPFLGNGLLFWHDRQNLPVTPKTPTLSPRRPVFQTPLPLTPKSYTWTLQSLYTASPENAFFACEQAAATNKPAAWYVLGLLYERGQGTQQNHEEAQKCFEQARLLYSSYDIQSEDDAYIQAMMYYFGKGVSRNSVKAQIHLFNAITSPQTNQRQALYIIGSASLLQRDHVARGIRYLQQALQLYEKLEHKSVYDTLVYIDIQRMLASQHDRDNTNRSLSYIHISTGTNAQNEFDEQYEALKQFCLKSENQDDMHALFVLGLLSDPRFNQQGSLQHCQTWYEKAIEKGHYFAHIALAKTLSADLPTEQNISTRRTLLQKEMFTKDPDALFELAITFPQRSTEFQDYMNKAAQLGHRKAQAYCSNSPHPASLLPLEELALRELAIFL